MRIRCAAVALALVLAGFGPAAAPRSAWALDDGAKRIRIDQLYQEYRSAFPGIHEIEAAQLLALMGRMPLVLVDARDARERAVSMLPGAIPAEAFTAHAESHRGALVVVYCTIGYRSGQLARTLRGQHIPTVNLRGGILAWLHAGGTVEADGRVVRRVHVYGAAWDLAPAGYEAIW
jgi:sodium/bile acid cotransporter 7